MSKNIFEIIVAVNYNFTFKFLIQSNRILRSRTNLLTNKILKILLLYIYTF